MSFWGAWVGGVKFWWKIILFTFLLNLRIWKKRSAMTTLHKIKIPTFSVTYSGDSHPYLWLYSWGTIMISMQHSNTEPENGLFSNSTCLTLEEAACQEAILGWLHYNETKLTVTSFSSTASLLLKHISLVLTCTKSIHWVVLSLVTTLYQML